MIKIIDGNDWILAAKRSNKPYNVRIIMPLEHPIISGLSGTLLSAMLLTVVFLCTKIMGDFSQE
jgi:hypothetical protein